LRVAMDQDLEQFRLSFYLYVTGLLLQVPNQQSMILTLKFTSIKLGLSVLSKL